MQTLVPVHTLVVVGCPNCHGDIVVDVVMVDTGDRPPKRTEWALGVGDENRVQCGHCQYESSRRELVERSELDDQVQARAFVAFRAARRVG